MLKINIRTGHRLSGDEESKSDKFKLKYTASRKMLFHCFTEL